MGILISQYLVSLLWLSDPNILSAVTAVTLPFTSSSFFFAFSVSLDLSFFCCLNFGFETLTKTVERIAYKIYSLCILEM